MPKKADFFQRLFTGPVTFVKDGHEYYVEEDAVTKKVDSLSRVLKKTGLAHEYAGDVPQYVLEKAATRGSDVHQAVHKLLNGQPYTVQEEDRKPYIEEAGRLIRQRDMRPVSSEVPHYNPVFDYCCTPDFVGWVDEKPAIVDWKTTSRIYWETGFQLAGQALCYREPEAFALYVGDLKSGLLQPFNDLRFFRFLQTALQLRVDVKDFGEEFEHDPQ